MRWPVEAIGVVAQVNPRLAATDRPDLDEMVSFVPMAAVSGETLSIEAQDERLFSEVSKGYTPFKRGDVLVAKITPCFENGKMAMANNIAYELGFGTTEFHVFRPSERITGSYLFNLLRAPYVRKAGVMRMKGAAGQRRVPADFFAALQVPIPPLAEQKRIAGILDAADALRTKRREALGQLDTLLQSTFLDMFGDPVTNPMKWTTSTLGQVGEIITGNTPSRSRPEYYGEDIEWIKSDNINDPSFVLTEARERLSAAGKAVARTVPRESILVTCIAGTPSCIGNVAVADREVAFNQQINAFVPGECLALWFAFGVFWVGKQLVNSASTNSMKGMVSKSAFSAIPIPIPPMSLQRRFAAIVESVERQKATQRAHLAELDTLFASMQSRAFRGDL